MTRFYTDETKAAVLAALLSGQAVTKVAEEYNIPRNTVQKWRTANGIFDRIYSEQKKDIGELLLQYMTENLETLRQQAIIFRNPEWLMSQTASDAAVLHGVMTDKTIRLLEALNKSVAKDNPTEG